MWEKRGELWDSFLAASPEQQAEMIGKVVGEIEVMIASSAAGGAAVKGIEKVAKVGGVVGKTAAAAKTVVDLPGRAVGALGKGAGAVVRGVGTVVWLGHQGCISQPIPSNG